MSSGRLFQSFGQTNGLRQLRDATGGHQVGWKSPTVDDEICLCLLRENYVTGRNVTVSVMKL